MDRRLLAITGVLVGCAILLSAMLVVRSGKKQPTENAAPADKGTETLLNEASALEEKGMFLEAKQLYQDLINRDPQAVLDQGIQKKIWDLNLKILFSKTPTPDSEIYEVQPGDTLGKIAKSFGTTVELLKISNELKSDLIRPGARLKVSTAKYSIMVDKSQNVLTLKSDENILKIYEVSTGLYNSTPVGDFKVVNKLIDPVWYSAEAIVPPGSPKNILGSRWLGISVTGYGIHGTTEPETIGQQITAGCVRMRNEEVEELYAIVPVGADVTITD